MAELLLKRLVKLSCSQQYLNPNHPLAAVMTTFYSKHYSSSKSFSSELPKYALSSNVNAILTQDQSKRINSFRRALKSQAKAAERPLIKGEDVIGSNKSQSHGEDANKQFDKISNGDSQKINTLVNEINLNKTSKFNKENDQGIQMSSILDNDWKEMKIDYGKLIGFYSKLSKKNLTALVVATTMMGCVMAPMPFDPYIFCLTTLGTTLTSSSANTINQWLEVPYDSQMNRTKDRVLVRGNLSPLHAFSFASICGISGVGILYFCINPLTAALGASTLFLYTAIYTPMKRLSALNTWVGSIVGAIPPLMGYTAMVDHVSAAGILMAAILYSWQFPHFHALSWNLRQEYSKAGYRMIAVLNPRICTSSAFSHTVALTLMCSLLSPMLELTTWNFAIDSLPFNLYFMYLAAKFKSNADAKSSRDLFRFSLIYLPLIILLMFITKYPYDDADKHKTRLEMETNNPVNQDIKYIKEKLEEHKDLFINRSIPFYYETKKPSTPNFGTEKTSIGMPSTKIDDKSNKVS